MIFDGASIEEKIGYEFKDKMLLRKCFTHSSYANEHNEEDNELLEFFGDAIIKFIESEYLYKNTFGDEGSLTEKRKTLESNVALLNTVKKLELDKFVLLGKGQEKNVSHKEKLFSSIYEALVAGLYLDGGMEVAKKFIGNTILTDFAVKEKKAKQQEKIGDYKTQFQEYVQKNKLGSITYEILSKKGPDHMPEFRVAVLLNGKPLAEGKGASKKLAEAKSAFIALKKLKNQGSKNCEF